MRGGDWQFKTLFLVGQSSNPAGKDGEEKAPPNYRQASKQKRKKEVKKKVQLAAAALKRQTRR
jgi:hypothetical protein